MTSLIPLYIKTIYKDEPVFRNAKIVFSVFENEFEANLGKDFGRKASLNNIDAKQMGTFKDGDCQSLYMGAIEHADAIVKCSDNIDPKVVKQLTAQTKKGTVVLEHAENGDGFADRYTDLYDALLVRQN